MRVIGRTDLPPTQQRALKQAIRWEWGTIAYSAVTIATVAFVVGNSQAMKTAWIEDMLSVIPQVSFLVALLFIRRPPTRGFPFGRHRAMGVGHLVAGVALFGVGAHLAIESATALISRQHPTIGSVVLFGTTVWQGWLMVAVMSVIVIGPFIYGRAKLRIAKQLHNKLLYADAAMARADWQTNVASIIGVLGVGVGLWWLDGVAALFISIGIVKDGFTSTRFAVRDLMDERARTHDDSAPDPLIWQILGEVRREPWVRFAGLRMRDQGQVFHTEVFVVPVRDKPLKTRDLERLARELAALDWKVQDIVIIPVSNLPDEATV